MSAKGANKKKKVSAKGKGERQRRKQKEKDEHRRKRVSAKGANKKKKESAKGKSERQGRKRIRSKRIAEGLESDLDLEFYLGLGGQGLQKPEAFARKRDLHTGRSRP